MWQTNEPHKRLRSHFRRSAAGLPVVVHEFPEYEFANFQLAIRELIEGSGTKVDRFGIVNNIPGTEVKLAFVANPNSKQFTIGPVAYLDVATANGNLSCVKEGMLLWHYQKQPMAMLVRSMVTFVSLQQEIIVEVMAAERELAEQFLVQLEREVHFGRAFRGNVLSIESDHIGNVKVKFHQLPKVTSDTIVLPKQTLERVRRHTIDFTANAKRLKSAGRHLKRGLLLHGPPGTGKTLCAMYVAAEMKGRTVLLITNASLVGLERTCRLARQLQPATVILEDVDLFGGMREQQAADANAVLLKLLDQMDGLSEDADILFLLTTNRPDVLEPALTSRPGRIDQAIEIPLPDAECRRRLLARYCEGLSAEGVDWDRLISQLESVSAAFIRELVRRAALLAAIEQGSGEISINVRDGHFREATEELLHGGALARRLLGFSGKP